MTGTADAYPWSSFAGNTGTKKDPLLTPHGLYLSLGQEICERHVNYRALFGTPIPTAQIDAIRQALARNHPVGMPPPPKERKCARM